MSYSISKLLRLILISMLLASFNTQDANVATLDSETYDALNANNENINQINLSSSSYVMKEISNFQKVAGGGFDLYVYFKDPTVQIDIIVSNTDITKYLGDLKTIPNEIEVQIATTTSENFNLFKFNIDALFENYIITSFFIYAKLKSGNDQVVDSEMFYSFNEYQYTASTESKFNVNVNDASMKILIERRPENKEAFHTFFRYNPKLKNCKIMIESIQNPILQTRRFTEIMDVDEDNESVVTDFYYKFPKSALKVSEFYLVEIISDESGACSGDFFVSKGIKPSEIDYQTPAFVVLENGAEASIALKNSYLSTTRNIKISTFNDSKVFYGIGAAPTNQIESNSVFIFTSSKDETLNLKASGTISVVIIEYTIPLDAFGPTNSIVNAGNKFTIFTVKLNDPDSRQSNIILNGSKEIRKVYYKIENIEKNSNSISLPFLTEENRRNLMTGIALNKMFLSIDNMNFQGYAIFVVYYKDDFNFSITKCKIFDANKEYSITLTKGNKECISVRNPDDYDKESDVMFNLFTENKNVSFYSEIFDIPKTKAQVYNYKEASDYKKKGTPKVYLESNDPTATVVFSFYVYRNANQSEVTLVNKDLTINSVNSLISWKNSVSPNYNYYVYVNTASNKEDTFATLWLQNLLKKVTDLFYNIPDNLAVPQKRIYVYGLNKVSGILVKYITITDVNKGTECIDPVNPNLKSITTLKKKKDSKTGKCVSSCADNECFDTDFSCKGLSKSVVQDIDLKCVSFCSDPNKCFNTATFKCQDANKDNISQGNGAECSSTCLNKTQCFNPTTFVCNVPTETQISNGDGAACSSKCSNINNCYDAFDYLCKPGKDGKVSNSDGGLCTPVCKNIDNCYDPTTFTCSSPTINKLSHSDGAVCAKKCNNEFKCFDPNNFKCINPSGGRLSNGDAGVCSDKCLDSTKCYDPKTFICNVANASNISNLDGGVCSTKCNDTSKCYDSANFVCRSPSVGAVIDSVGGACLSACPGIKCFDSLTFKCQTPILNAISNNDGSSCTTACKDSSKCYDSTFTCKAASASNVSNSDGGVCTQICKDLNKCMNSSTFVCQVPTISQLSNGDGKSCTSKCADSQKCYNSAFVCQTPDKNLLSNQDGGECTSKCNDLNKCFDRADYICKAPSKNKVSNADGSVCSFACTNPSKCSNASFICQTPAKGLVSNLDGGSCSSVCSDKTKCANDSFICQIPSIGFASNNDGDSCIASCKNKSQCINPTTLTCQNPANKLLANGDGLACRETCQLDKCFDPKSFICVTPSAGLISNSDGLACVTQCADQNKCYDKNFICVSPSISKVSTGRGDACLTKCEDKKCFDSSFVCKDASIGNILDNGECKPRCSDYSQVFESGKFVCKPAFKENLSIFNGGQSLPICDEKTKCYNPKTFVCQRPTPGNISNGDGGVCSDKCIDKVKCFDSDKLICQSPNASQISNGDGGVCGTRCCDINQCFDPNSFVCQAPTLGKFSNADGGACTVTCKDKNKCANESSYVCQSSVPGSISNLDGDICTSSCKDKSKCYNSLTFACQTATSDQLKSSSGSVCVNSCSLGKCWNPTTFECVNPTNGLLALGDGAVCATKCPLTKCYDPTTYVCQLPSFGLTLNGDGGACSPKCADTNQCIDSKLTCVSPSVGKINDKGYCRTTCSTLGECFDTKTFTCRKPADGFISNNDGAECTAKCKDPLKCINLDTFTCQSASYGLISNKDGLACGTKCLDQSLCFDRKDFICNMPPANKYANKGLECKHFIPEESAVIVTPDSTEVILDKRGFYAIDMKSAKDTVKLTLDDTLFSGTYVNTKKQFKDLLLVDFTTDRKPVINTPLTNSKTDSYMLVTVSLKYNNASEKSNDEFSEFIPAEEVNINQYYTRQASKTKPFIAKIDAKTISTAVLANKFIYIGCRSCSLDNKIKVYSSYKEIGYDSVGGVTSYDFRTYVADLSQLIFNLDKAATTEFLYFAIYSSNDSFISTTFEFFVRDSLMVSSSSLFSTNTKYNYQLAAGEKLYILSRKINDFAVYNNVFEGFSTFKVSQKWTVYHLVNPQTCGYDALPSYEKFAFISNPSLVEAFTIEITAAKPTVGEISITGISNPIFTTNISQNSEKDLDFIYSIPVGRKETFKSNDNLIAKFKTGLLSATLLSSSRDSGSVDFSLLPGFNKSNPYKAVQASLPASITFANNDSTSLNMYLHFRFLNELKSYKSLIISKNTDLSLGKSTNSIVKLVEFNSALDGKINVLSNLTLTSSTGYISNFNYKIIDNASAIVGDSLYENLKENDLINQTMKSNNFNINFKNSQPSDKNYYVLLTFDFELNNSLAGTSDVSIAIKRVAYNPLAQTPVRITAHVDNRIDLLKIGNYVVTPKVDTAGQYEFDYTSQVVIKDGDIITIVASDAEFAAGRARENWNGYCVEARFEFTDRNGQLRNIVTNLADWKCDGLPSVEGYRLVAEHPRLLEATRIWGNVPYGTTVCKYLYRETPQALPEVEGWVWGDDFVGDVKIGNNFIFTPVPTADLCKVSHFKTTINIQDGDEFMIRGFNGSDWAGFDKGNAVGVAGKFNIKYPDGSTKVVVTNLENWKCNGQSPVRGGWNLNEWAPGIEIWSNQQSLALGSCSYIYKRN